jgi:copper(I)-binding protein
VSRTRPTILLAGALAGALALAGCGAGQVANTSEQLANAPGANVATGPMSVRDAVIVYGDSVEGPVWARGDSAPLSLTLVNDGTETDRLVSASSPFAQSVELSGDLEVSSGTALFIEGEGAGASAAGASGAVTTPTVPPSAAQAAPSAAPGPPTAPATTTPPAAPSGAAASGAAPTGTASPSEDASIVLTGLTDDIRAGVSYPVTLVFERAGELTLDVPVDNPEEPREVSEDSESE